MTETQERFLRTVLTRVPVDSVVELYLFPPIRRGTLETGVAFIATVLPPVALAVVTDADVDAEAELAGDSDEAAEAAEAAEAIEATVTDPFVLEFAPDPDSPYADEPAALTESDIAETADEDVEAVDDVRVTAPSPRMRILTASYRHTIKGVERGKWIVDVQDEADAPLDAVEAVLRGVRHRSTEPADPEQVSHDALIALIAPSAVAPAA
jgi:hypothetical protein